MDTWGIVALVFAVGMLLSILGSIRLLGQSAQPGPGYWLQRFEHACVKHDPGAAEQALVAWGAAMYSEQAPKTLDGLAEHLQSDEARRQIRLLQEVRYRSDAPEWNSYLCRQVLGEQLRRQMAQL